MATVVSMLSRGGLPPEGERVASHDPPARPISQRRSRQSTRPA